MDNEIYAKVVRLGPDDARELLANNLINRVLSKILVSKYAKIMSAGGWVINGETIGVSTSGQLLNGQHRLRAIIECEKEVEMFVAYNLDIKNFDTIDTGRSRTAVDVLTIDGYNRRTAAALATAARLNIAMASVGNIEMAAQMGDLTTPHLISKEIRSDKRYLEAVEFLSAYKKTDLPIPMPSMSFAVYRFFIIDKDFSKKWLHGFITGENLKHNDYRLWVRNKITRTNSTPLSLSNYQKLYILIKAWRYSLDGREVSGEKSFIAASRGVLQYMHIDGDKVILSGSASKFKSGKIIKTKL